MRKDLTVRQREIYNCIVAFIGGHGYSPTYHEIADITGLANTTIYDSIGRLCDKGYIKLSDERKTRRIRLTMLEEEVYVG